MIGAGTYGINKSGLVRLNIAEADGLWPFGWQEDKLLSLSVRRVGLHGHQDGRVGAIRLRCEGVGLNGS